MIETAVRSEPDFAPDLEPGFARRAEGLHLRGDSAAALRILTAGAARDPGDLTTRLVLARVCRETGREDEARDWLESALRSDPDCPAALFQLSELLEGLEETGAAAHRDPLRTRLRTQEPWDSGYEVADAVVFRNEVPASAPRLEPRAVPKDTTPTFTFPVREEEEEPEIEENSAPHVATVTLAEIYLQQGLKEQAAQIYRQLLERQPGDDSVRRRLQEIEGI